MKGKIKKEMLRNLNHKATYLRSDETMLLLLLALMMTMMMMMLM